MKTKACCLSEKPKTEGQKIARRFIAVNPRAHKKMQTSLDVLSSRCQLEDTTSDCSGSRRGKSASNKIKR